MEIYLTCKTPKTTSFPPSINPYQFPEPSPPPPKTRKKTSTMSLLRTIALRAPRATITTPLRFSTSPLAHKDSGSAVKETIDSVNKAVGDAAVRGIEKGRELPPNQPILPSFLSPAFLPSLSSMPKKKKYMTNAPPPLSLHRQSKRPNPSNRPSGSTPRRPRAPRRK